MTREFEMGAWVVVNGETARVVGVCPGDPSRVPVQFTDTGRLVLVPVEELT